MRWRVRVDLFADDHEGFRVDQCARALDALLVNDEGPGPDHGCGVDQGDGVADRPVIGLLFWVRADDVGGAATIAVSTVVRASSTVKGVGPDLYDVVVIPEHAVVMPGNRRYPHL